MIKYEIKNDYLKVFFDNQCTPYSISLFDLEEAIDWEVVKCRGEIIIAKNVSKWTLHLITSKNLSIEFAKEFQDIIKLHSPKNNIDWEETEKALVVHDEYRELCLKNDKEKEEVFTSLKDYNFETIIEIIKYLKKKYYQ